MTSGNSQSGKDLVEGNSTFNSFSLLPPTTLSVDLEEHQNILLKARSESLGYLVTGKTPKDVVFKKPGRGGSQQDYVPGWWFIEQANAIFGLNGWSMRIKEYRVDEKISQVSCLVQIEVYIPERHCKRTSSDGSIEEVNIPSFTVVKEQWGGSDFKKKKDGTVIDLADDLKSASTDGMKKCFSLMGFARDIYGRREVIDELAGLSDEDIKLRRFLANAKVVNQNWSREQSIEWVEKTSGKKLEILDEIDVFALIGKLPKVS